MYFGLLLQKDPNNLLVEYVAGRSDKPTVVSTGPLGVQSNTVGRCMKAVGIINSKRFFLSHNGYPSINDGLSAGDVTFTIRAP